MAQERIEAALARIASAARRIGAASPHVEHTDFASAPLASGSVDRTLVEQALADLDALLEQIEPSERANR